MRGDERAGQHIAVAVELLGRGVEDHVDAMLERTRVYRCRSRVVRDHERADQSFGRLTGRVLIARVRVSAGVRTVLVPYVGRGREDRGYETTEGRLRVAGRTCGASARVHARSVARDPYGCGVNRTASLM